jgi:acyl-CoA thioesterase-1
MRISTTLPFLFCLLLMTRPACSQAGADDHADSAVLLVLGDSLSAAYGIPQDQGWVALLQLRLTDQGYPLRVVNASISGETSHGGLSRLPQLLERHRPLLTIVELGANDGLRGLGLQHTRDNLAQIVARCRQQGSRVLLLGVELPANYGSAYRAQFRALYREVAEQSQIALVPFFLAGVAEDLDLMQADGLHPTAAAQPRILDNVWDRLQPLLPAPVD